MGSCSTFLRTWLLPIPPSISFAPAVGTGRLGLSPWRPCGRRVRSFPHSVFTTESFRGPRARVPATFYILRMIVHLLPFIPRAPEFGLVWSTAGFLPFLEPRSNTSGVEAPNPPNYIAKPSPGYTDPRLIIRDRKRLCISALDIEYYPIFSAANLLVTHHQGLNRACLLNPDYCGWTSQGLIGDRWATDLT